MLAKLLRTDFLPLVWEPDENTEGLRVLVSRPAGLVAARTRLKNRIHAVLAHGLIATPEGDLFGMKGRAWLEKQELPARARTLIDSDLRLLSAGEAEPETLDATLIKVTVGPSAAETTQTCRKHPAPCPSVARPRAVDQPERRLRRARTRVPAGLRRLRSQRRKSFAFQEE